MTVVIGCHDLEQLIAPYGQIYAETPRNDDLYPSMNTTTATRGKRFLLFWTCVLHCTGLMLYGSTQLRSQDRIDFVKLIEKENLILNISLDPQIVMDTFAVWKSEFDKHFPSNAEIPVDSVSTFLFYTLHIKAERDSIRLQSLIRSRTGNCVTISMLYHMLAGDRLGKSYVVHVPEHFFIRTCPENGACLNTEPTQKGFHLPDRFYISSKQISDEAIRKGLYMRAHPFSFLEQAYIQNLLVLLLAQGDHQKALAIYLSLPDSSMQHPEWLVNRGDSYFAHGLHGDAIHDYSSAISMYDQDSRYFERRGKALVNAERCAEAIEDFTRVLHDLPEYFLIRFYRGKAYFNCQMLKKACDDWSAAAKAGLHEAEVIYRRHCQ